MSEREYTINMKRDILIILGVVLVAVAIGVIVMLGQSQAPGAQIPTTSQLAAVAVPFEMLAQGETSKVTDRVNYVITSPDELTRLWALVDATGTPPAIDFSTKSVLAVFAGKGPSAHITVVHITDADTRTVAVAVAEPDTSCAKKAVVSPYELVVVPTTTLPLTHKDTTTPLSCAN